MVANWRFLAPEDGRLPSNAVGVAWYGSSLNEPYSREDVLARVTVETKHGDTFREVPATARELTEFRRVFAIDPGRVFVIGPEGGLEAGSTYRLTDHGEHLQSFPRQVLVTVDSTPLEPETPLSASAWPLYSEMIPVAGGGACKTWFFVAQVLIETTLPETAGRWENQLLYRTFVNGEPWHPREHLCSVVPPGRSWRETGEDLVYSVCPDPPDLDRDIYGWRGSHYLRQLEAGQHSVTMQAFLPGTDIVLESRAMAVDLSCPGPIEGE